MGTSIFKKAAWFSGCCFPILMVAACGPGAAPSGAVPSTSSSITAAWATGSGGTENAATAAIIANSAEFFAVDADFIRAGNRPNAFKLINLDKALSTGLTGAGELVAIVDDGFRITHNEFLGKTIHTFGATGVDGGSSHGTMVAAIATGNYGDGGTMGVAPGANLHLSSFNNSLSNLALATADAATEGAVVQNNSWGIDRSVVQAQSLMNSGQTAAEALNNLVGGGETGWQNYIDALDAFQNTGVIVFANANNNLGDVDINAGLPLLAPELAEAWITASEVEFTINPGTEAIVSAQLLSSPCGQAAAFCLVGDGELWSAGADADNYYEANAGTSFVAPQISGAVALLAEAFPGLTPGEWRDRLLASADNTFFTNDIDGTTNFGGGVTHGFSDVFGHGVLNVSAALQPIGNVSVVRGANVQSGDRLTLSEATISTGAGFGDGLTRMLQDREIAVFDALNGDFRMGADLLTEQNGFEFSSTSTDRLTDKGQLRSSFSFGEDSDSVTNVLYFGAQDGLVNLQADLGLASDLAQNVSVLSFADTATAVYQSHDTAFGRYGFYGFTSQHSENVDGSLSGAGAHASFELGGTELNVGFNQLMENGAFLGLVGNDAFDTPTLAHAQSANLSISSNLTEGFTMFGGAEIGRAVGQASGDGFVQQFNDAQFSGFHLGVAQTDLLQQGDRMTFSIAQPLRAVAGNVTMMLPVGREKNGDIIYESVTGNISPSGQELDLAASYFVQTDPFSSLQFDVMYALDAGHVAGERSYGVGASFKRDLN